MALFKIGDTVKRTNGSNDGFIYGETAEIVLIDWNRGDVCIRVNRGTQDNWHNIHNLILIKSNNCCDEIISTVKNTMSSIIDFAKNIALTADEKLLRKQGLKDACGDYTEDARKLVSNKLMKENEEYLITIAEAKEKEEKENK